MISLCMDSAYKALVLGLYKDGTLIDFQSLWLQAANEVTDLLIRINGLEKSLGKRNFILEAIGYMEQSK